MRIKEVNHEQSLTLVLFFLFLFLFKIEHLEHLKMLCRCTDDLQF